MSFRSVTSTCLTVDEWEHKKSDYFSRIRVRGSDLSRHHFMIACAIGGSFTP